MRAEGPLTRGMCPPGGSLTLVPRLLEPRMGETWRLSRGDPHRISCVEQCFTKKSLVKKVPESNAKMRYCYALLTVGEPIQRINNPLSSTEHMYVVELGSEPRPS